MTDSHRDDGLMRRLRELPGDGGSDGADARRARRVRARCRAELESRRRKRTRSSYALDAALAVLSAAYLMQVARLALMLR